ncbi:MAG TPA: hypothetical protein PLF81_01535 [Candidatus Anammoximicrobium sp.]|nr:hypothetical protein [Candidatus Anammoximicrobium sp.]
MIRRAPDCGKHLLSEEVAHLCGAYLRNECGKRALPDAAETPDAEALAAITAANAEAGRWMPAAAGSG